MIWFVSELFEPRRRLSFPDSVPVMMAVGAWCGARWHFFVAETLEAVPTGIALFAVAGALLRSVSWIARASSDGQGAAPSLDVMPRRTKGLAAALVLAAFAATSWLGTRAEAGVRSTPPVSANGIVTVVSDAEWFGSALRIDVRLDSRRYEVWARGPAAWSGSPRPEAALAGQRWQITGTVSPADAPYLVPRHIGARIEAQHLAFVDGGALPFAFANGLRRRIGISSRSMGQRDRILLAGFVYGDDRGQLPEVVDDFRASGLTHLLAVSGQNVAFVLAMIAPILQRLSRVSGFVVLSLVLAEFAVVTRGEPSVLRACLLAMVAVGAKSLGYPSSTLRLLAVVVTALVIVDPLLVLSVGFQLSVAASSAIVLWANKIELAIGGPQWLSGPLAVTIAAQVGVLPVQVLTFGALPLVSIPANLLAGPASGPIMIWGMFAGIVGGTLGEPLAGLLHRPTTLLVGWVAAVARAAALLGGPVLDRRAAVVAGLVGLLLWWVVASRWRLAMAGCVVCAASLLSTPVPISASRASNHASIENANGRLVLVVDRPDPASLLGALRAAGVSHIDVLVVQSASRGATDAVRATLARHGVDEVWAPVGFAPWIEHRPLLEPRALGGDLVIAPLGTRLVVERPRTPELER